MSDDLSGAEPLAPDWLPNGSPREGSAEWQHLRDRVLEAGAVELRRLAPGPEAEALAWYGIIASWWRPAVGLAAAAAVLLILGPRPPQHDAAEVSIPLSVIAAGGQPYALWHGIGAEADPVLALIAIELGGDAPPQR